MGFVVGEQVGVYRVVEQLGQGGMSTVYRAYHAALDRYVALKVLHPMFKGDVEFLARFQREARIVARLEHPNIVAVYDYSEHEGTPYLVMRFVEGQTLKALLGQEHPLPPARIVEILRPVGEALEYAHGQGVLHRDVKPSNVLIGRDGRVFVTDFGLARMVQSADATISQDRMIGTPQYISPEQARGDAIDHRTDLYSLGVVLYEMVTGRVPYTADTPFAVVHDHIFSPLPLPSRVNPAVAPAVEQVILKALAKAPVDRYQGARELLQALSAAVGPLGEAAAVPAAAAQTAAAGAVPATPAAAEAAVPSTVSFAVPEAAAAVPPPAVPAPETPAAEIAAPAPSGATPASAAAGLWAAIGQAVAPGMAEVREAWAQAREEMAGGLSKAAEELRAALPGQAAPGSPEAAAPAPSTAPGASEAAASVPAAPGPTAAGTAAAPVPSIPPGRARPPRRRWLLWAGLALAAAALLTALGILVVVPALRDRAEPAPPARTAGPVPPPANRTAPPQTEAAPPLAAWGEPYPIRVDAGFAAPGTLPRPEAEVKLQQLEEQIGRDPQNAALHLQRGNVLFLLERYADAAAAYEQSYGLPGALPWAHYNRGVALLYLRQPEAALGEFERAQKAAGDRAEACLFFNLALTHAMLEHREPAVAALREFLRLAAAGDDMWRRRAVEMLRRWGEEP